MSHRRRTAVLLSAVATALAAPAAATAGPLVAVAPSCAAQSASQVCLPPAAAANHVLAPARAAESAGGWQLSAGASIGLGNEPWKSHGAGDARSPAVSPGA